MFMACDSAFVILVRYRTYIDIPISNLFVLSSFYIKSFMFKFLD